MKNIVKFRRNIDGIIILDKPIGLSSNALLQKVKNLFNANKAGHTGALDPLATGILPICLGEATKFSKYLFNADKVYRVTAKLGKRTDTSDAEGKILNTRPVILNKLKLDNALAHFIGNIYQKPSIFSAIKYKGIPLYEYARKGILVPSKYRAIKIYNCKLLHWNKHDIIELEINCSKGTYIRTIIDDLGEYLGCGAYVTALRRIAVAQYSAQHMVTIDRLKTIVKDNKKINLEELDTFLLPLDHAIATVIPTVNINSDIAVLVRLGQKVKVNMKFTGIVRITEGKDKRFLGIGEINSLGDLYPNRLVVN